jgi:TonB family protein
MLIFWTAALVTAAVWQLGMALLRGEVAGRLGRDYARAEHPRMFWAIVAASGLVVLAAAAAAAGWLVLRTTGWDPRSLVGLDRASMFSRYYPERAQREDVPGDVSLSCQVTKDDKLQACRVLSETPAGYGFGKAAVQLAGLMTLPPKDLAHVRPGERVQIPIKFRLPQEDRR